MNFNSTTKTFEIGNNKYEKNVTPIYCDEYEYFENSRKSTSISNDGSEPESCEEKFDSHGNMILRTYEDGSQQVFKYDYDEKGNVIHYQSGTYEEWFEYNSSGKLTSAKDSEGIEVLFDYDEKGNLIHERPSDGLEIFREYDENDHQIKETIKLKDGNDEIHFFEYDSENHLVLEYIKKRHDELWEYKYNSDGKLISKVWYTVEREKKC